jgi:hypothetical protein
MTGTLVCSSANREHAVLPTPAFAQGAKVTEVTEVTEVTVVAARDEGRLAAVRCLGVATPATADLPTTSGCEIPAESGVVAARWQQLSILRGENTPSCKDQIKRRANT